MDAGVMDAGVMDAGVMDAGVMDAGVMDAGVPVLANFGAGVLIKPPMMLTSGSFGTAVSVSADGLHLAIGDSMNRAVHLYRYDGANWSYVNTLLGTVTSFGKAVALSADGGELIVGAPDETVLGSWVGQLNTSSGTLVEVQQAPPNSFVGMGFSVSMTSSARWAVGVPGAGSDTCPQANCRGGQVLLGDNLTVPYFGAQTTQELGGFGWSVALSDSSEQLAVGARGEGRSGIVHLLSADAGWAETANLSSTGVTAAALLGQSVATNANGTVIASGAPGDTVDGGLTQAGAVVVFSRELDAGWSETVLREATPGGFRYFGRAVGLSADARVLAMSGVSVLVLDRATNGFQTFNASATSDFGASLSLSPDGRVMAVGAPSDERTCTGVAPTTCFSDAMSHGAVYVYRRP